MFNCSVFKQKSVSERREWARTASVCFNCLLPGHRIHDCRSKHTCKECQARHHTLLHESRSSSSISDNVHSDGTVNVASNPLAGSSAFALPSTAIIRVRADSLVQRARAQMDSGASISLMTRSLATTLKASKLPDSGANISGVGGTLTSTHCVEVTLMGDEGEEIPVKFHVVDAIPSTESKADVRRIFELPFLDGLQLSDPGYTSASRIDMLLDMGVANMCTKDGVKHSTNRALKAESTVFGWIVGGHDSPSNQRSSIEPTCLKVNATPDNLERYMQAAPR